MERTRIGLAVLTETSTVRCGLSPREVVLLTAVERALANLGAEVKLGRERENLVRLRSGARPVVLRFEEDRVLPSTGELVIDVEAQGLENLLHELVHVLQSECLDDDHGFVYGRIPLDLAVPVDRATLWEELSCCVISCAYVSAPRPDETSAQMYARVDGWFREQVEIQPVFYGCEDDPARFWALVQTCVDAHRDEATMMLARGYRRLQRCLLGQGAAELAVPPVHWTLEQMLHRMADMASGGDVESEWDERKR